MFFLCIVYPQKAQSLLPSWYEAILLILWKYRIDPLVRSNFFRLLHLGQGAPCNILHTFSFQNILPEPLK